MPRRYQGQSDEEFEKWLRSLPPISDKPGKTKMLFLAPKGSVALPEDDPESKKEADAEG